MTVFLDDERTTPAEAIRAYRADGVAVRLSPMVIAAFEQCAAQPPALPDIPA